jgi:hypothetical protein
MDPVQHGWKAPVKGRRGHPPSKGKGKAFRWLTENVSHAGDGCLIWPFGRDKRVNRGMLKHNGKNYWAHRLMCELVHGAPPTPKHQAAHNCGKGHYRCVNPRHLEWKTNAQNQLDRAKNGNALRNPHGPKGALTPEQKAEIIALKGTMTQMAIAAKFGISLGCVQYWQKYRHERGHHIPKMCYWPASEEAELRAALSGGASVVEIATLIGRSYGAVFNKIRRMGLLAVTQPNGDRT